VGDEGSRGPHSQFEVANEPYHVLAAAILSSSHVLLVAMASRFASPEAAYPHFTALVMEPTLTNDQPLRHGSGEQQRAFAATCPRLDFPLIRDAAPDAATAAALPMPVFAVHPVVPVLGSEYLYAPIGPTEVCEPRLLLTRHTRSARRGRIQLSPDFHVILFPMPR
jgi:hypothetical protein